MTHRRRGFSLIFAIFIVTRLGATLVLLARGFAIRYQSTSIEVLDVRAAQLMASGQAWARAHSDEVAKLSRGQSIDLPISDLVPPGSEATLRVGREDGGAVMIAATVHHGR